jgi:hypothetical protein
VAGCVEDGMPNPGRECRRAAVSTSRQALRAPQTRPPVQPALLRQCRASA